MLNVSKCLKLVEHYHSSQFVSRHPLKRKKERFSVSSFKHTTPPGTPRPPIFKFWQQSFMICFFPILDVNQKRNDDKENEIDTEKKEWQDMIQDYQLSFGYLRI